jgi:hypothetical protein
MLPAFSFEPSQLQSYLRKQADIPCNRDSCKLYTPLETPRCKFFFGDSWLGRSSVQWKGCQPIGHLGPVDLAALPISTFEMGCRFVRGLLPLRLAHLEKLFSDSVLGHVAELIEDCQNGRTADVTFL